MRPLPSYDHHHVKVRGELLVTSCEPPAAAITLLRAPVADSLVVQRQADLRKADRARKVTVDRSKEQKKEWEQMQRMANTAAAAATASTTASATDSNSTATPNTLTGGAITASNTTAVAPPEQRTAVKFSFGAKLGPRKKKP